MKVAQAYRRTSGLAWTDPTAFPRTRRRSEEIDTSECLADALALLAAAGAAAAAAAATAVCARRTAIVVPPSLVISTRDWREAHRLSKKIPVLLTNGRSH